MMKNNYVLTNPTKTIAVFLLICFSYSLQSQSQKKLTAIKSLQNSQPNNQVTFTENKGQVGDQNRKPRPDVLFGGSVNGLIYHLRKTGISYQLEKVATWKKDPYSEENVALRVLASNNNKASMVPDKISVQRVDIEWVKSNPNSLIIKDKVLDGYANYYNGVVPGGAENVRSYTGVTYKNIYQNIDLHYYSLEGQLKYDFIVAPNTDYHQIKLAIKGADKIELQNDGSIIIKTPFGDISEGEPLVFQNGKKLAANWVIKNNELNLNIAGHNPALPLIIDPITRIWGSYYGTVDQDGLWGTTSDANGDIYAVGSAGTSSGTLIATTGVFQSTFGGGLEDAILVKFTVAGARIWATYFGDNGDERGLTISQSGTSIYITGTTTSTTGIASSTNVFQPNFGGGNQDAFFAKFNTSGARQWSTYYGDAGEEIPWTCPTFSNTDVYFCMTTFSISATSNSVLATPLSHQPTFGGGNSDAVLAKFNPSGVRQWATFYGGTGNESAACAVDQLGNVYLSGRTTSTATPTVIVTSVAHQTVHAGGSDSYLVKFNSSGVRQWGTFYGDAGDEMDGFCATDVNNNVYLTGATSSTTGIATAAGHQTVYGGGAHDAYLVKFNSSGVRQWATYYGDAGEEYGNITNCSTDGFNNVYITGTTGSTNGMATSGAFQTTRAGDYDGYFAQFSAASGTLQYGTYFGGVGGELAKSSYIDAVGNIFLTGTTYTTQLDPSGSTTGIASSSAFQTTFAGDVDGYIARFADCNTITTPTDITAPGNFTLCSKRSATLSVSGGPTLNWYPTNTSNFILFTGGTYITPTLNPGTYTYYAGAVSSCSASTRVALSVTVITSPNVTVNTGSICTGGSLVLTPSGASTYTLVGSPAVVGPSGAATVNPIGTTNYIFTGTGTNGCTNAGIGAVATVTVNPLPTIVANSGSICIGNNYTITPTGASNYTYSSSSAIVSPTTNSSYSITGRSAQGCPASNTAVITVTVNTRPSITANSGTICIGQSFTIIPAGANTYTFSSNNAVVSPTATSNYSVTGLSAQGCPATNTAVLNVLVNPLPVLTFTGTNVICSGNSTTLTVSGADTYTWSGNIQSNTLAVTSATSNSGTTISKTVTATSLLGCVNTAVTTITVNPLPVISVNSGSICNGSNFVITASGASVYAYSSGTNVVTPTLGTTSYTVTGTSSLGCLSSNTVVSNVTVVPVPTVSIAGTASICLGGQTTLTAGGANTYTWNTSTNATVITVGPSSNQSYFLSGTTAGCTNSAMVTLSVLPLPTVSISGQQPICTGNSRTLTASGASTYLWSNASTTASTVVSPTATTVYSVVGTSTNSCSKSNTVSIVVYALPVLTVTGVSGVCPGGSGTLQVAGASTYTWSSININSGFISVSPTVATTYTVSGTSALGCVNSGVITVSIHPLPNLSYTISSPAICIGNSVTIGGVGAATYVWFGGAVNNTPFAPTSNTTYTLVGTDANGCTKQTTASVVVNPLPTVTITPVLYKFCQGETNTITAGGANNYLWSTGSTSQSITITPILTIGYTVTGTDVNGCVNNTIYTQTVLACTGINNQNSDLNFNIYPSPTHGIIKVQLSEFSQDLPTHLEIINMLGQSVLFSELKSQEQEVDLSTFSNGVYIIRLSNTDKIISKRIIKE